MSEHDNLQDADGENLESTIQKASNSEENKAATEAENELSSTVKDASKTPNLKKPKEVAIGSENTSEEIKKPEEAEQVLEAETKDAADEIKDNSTAEKIESEEAEQVLEAETKDAADETKDNSTAEKIESEDNFDKLSLEALVNTFESLLTNDNLQTVRSRINKIKNSFNSKFALLIAEKKEAFIAEGGNVIDFNFTSPLKKRFNLLSKDFREKQQTFQKNRTQELNQNLEIRLQIIEDIKGLINVEGDIHSTYKTFKNLQEHWRNTGQIPASENNNTWNNYRHHVEIFYGFLHLNRDLRDLDYKHNLEQKQKIIQSTEALANETDLNRAFRELQALHKIWKEELGPVAKEFKDELWERFSVATKVINDKRQDYYNQLEVIFNENLILKNNIIEQIKVISEKPTESHKDWQTNIKDIEKLRESFFKIGKVPSKQNEKTWSAFKGVVRVFNKNKNNYYKTLKKEQSENYRKKMELVEIAEQNKDSTDIKTTLVLMKDIQKRWKSIGHIPRKDSDKLWKRFRGACNLFFDRYHAQKNIGSEEEVKAFEEKTALLESVGSFVLTVDKEANMEALKQFSAAWKKMGAVVPSKRFIDAKFYKALDALYSKIGLDKKALENLKYSLKLETLSNDPHLFNKEVIFIRKKLDEIKSEINQLENNLQFFSNVEEDNPLVKEVHKKISTQKEALKIWDFKYSKIKKLIN